MGFAGACKAKTSNDLPTPAGYHRHVVVQRRYNESAFNGYRRTPSEYSSIRCINTGDYWRTKAAYVNDLPDQKPDDMRAVGIDPLVAVGHPAKES